MCNFLDTLKLIYYCLTLSMAKLKESSPQSRSVFCVSPLPLSGSSKSFFSTPPSPVCCILTYMQTSVNSTSTISFSPNFSLYQFLKVFAFSLERERGRRGGGDGEGGINQLPPLGTLPQNLTHHPSGVEDDSQLNHTGKGSPYHFKPHIGCYSSLPLVYLLTVPLCSILLMVIQLQN